MLRRMAAMKKAGVQVVVLLALSDDGRAGLRSRQCRGAELPSAFPRLRARRTSFRNCWRSLWNAATCRPGRINSHSNSADSNGTDSNSLEQPQTALTGLLRRPEHRVHPHDG